MEPDADEFGAVAHEGLVIDFSSGRPGFDHGPGYLGCTSEQVLPSILPFCPVSFMIHLLPMSFIFHRAHFQKDRVEPRIPVCKGYTIALHFD